MPNIRIPNGVAKTVVLKAYLSDGVTEATGKTIAIKISKNTAAFGDPNAGATNATEIANGWYYVSLNGTDTGSNGPLIVRGTATGVDPTEAVFEVCDAHNQGFDGIPSAAAEASGGLYTRGVGAGQINQPGNGLIDVSLKAILNTALTETAGQLAAAFKKFFNVGTPTGTVNSIPDAVAGAAGGLFIAGTNAATTVTTALTTTFTGNLTGSVGSVAGNVTGSVGSVAAGGITATSIATDAIDADALAADAIAEIQAGLSTLTAAQVWDLTNGIETGLTPRQAMKLIAAATAGKLSGAATVTVTIKNAVADNKNRIVATVDASGNRTGIVYDLT